MPQYKPSEFELAGLFEGIIADRAVGWAFDPRAPGDRICVTLISDGGASLKTCADVYRADLYHAGHGDGHAGFSVPLVWLGKTTSIRAFAGDNESELKGSPCPLNPLAKTLERNAGPLRLLVDPDKAAGLSFSGWVYDRTDPSRRCRVALRSGGRILAQAKATLFREDLALPGVDGFHGFHLAFDGHMPLPDRIDLIDHDTGAALITLRR